MIREINENDLCGLLKLYMYLHDNPFPELDCRIQGVWESIINDKNHHIIVAEEDGMIVSTCVCLIIPNLTRGQRPFALVENVVTHPDFRGKGLATACLNFAKDIALSENCTRLMLMTGSKEKSTLDMYEKAGYDPNDKKGFVQWLIDIH
ncbi:MAG: GNAT family N-acetyltransferase [Ruminococcus sp.]|uniref:GNAT family N-acetyltransferase n=1 Tax=Ruminococcus sp. TaxID=41978 RepID=UPI0025E242A2|nr:GNAT family N-acetyltransferase [Ruminococcus sp.]MCR5599599.1 GNAT family N-acetyltransferase [Ruminococcus sp.]